jgi:hypothetical protein
MSRVGSTGVGAMRPVRAVAPTWPLLRHEQDTRAGGPTFVDSCLTVLKSGRTGRWCAPTERILGGALPSVDSPPWKRDLVSSSTRTCCKLPSERPGSRFAGTRISRTLDCRSSREAPCAPCCGVRASRARRRPLGGQQDPKALQSLLDTHIYLRLKRDSDYDLAIYEMHIAIGSIYVPCLDTFFTAALVQSRALYARRPAHYAPARGGAILANDLFGTEQGPPAPEALPSIHTTHLLLIFTNIHTVCMLPPGLRMSRVRPMGIAVRCAGREHRVDGRRRPGTYRQTYSYGLRHMTGAKLLEGVQARVPRCRFRPPGWLRLFSPTAAVAGGA